MFHLNQRKLIRWLDVRNIEVYDVCIDVKLILLPTLGPNLISSFNLIVFYFNCPSLINCYSIISISKKNIKKKKKKKREVISQIHVLLKIGKL